MSSALCASLMSEKEQFAQQEGVIMKKFLIAIAALGMVFFHATTWAGDAAAKAEVCIDCHDADEFEGMSADEIAAATQEANANSEKMAKATADVSAEDLKEIIDYLAAEANK